MDLDKIISAWEHCTSDEGDCDDCPYNNDFNGCMLNLKLDTIEVLKYYKEEVEKLELDLAVTKNNLNYYINGND